MTGGSPASEREGGEGGEAGRAGEKKGETGRRGFLGRGRKRKRESWAGLKEGRKRKAFAFF